MEAENLVILAVGIGRPGAAKTGSPRRFGAIWRPDPLQPPGHYHNLPVGRYKGSVSTGRTGRLRFREVGHYQTLSTAEDIRVPTTKWNSGTPRNSS